MQKVILTGWKPGLRKIDLTKLIQNKADLSLAAAKACVDRLLAGEHGTILVPSPTAAEMFIADAAELGAIAEMENVLHGA